MDASEGIYIVFKNVQETIRKKIQYRSPTEEKSEAMGKQTEPRKEKKNKTNIDDKLQSSVEQSYSRCETPQ